MTNKISKSSIQVFGVLLAYSLALLMHARPVLAQEILLGGGGGDEFNYISGSEKGPEHWGELHKEWATCSNGKLQSPINLMWQSVEKAQGLGKLHMSYRSSYATLNNRDHDIMLRWKGDAGFIEIRGTKYFLKQMHWHHPSEHAINGRRFDLEAHLVHVSADNKIAVVAILYHYGRADPFLSRFEQDLWSLSHDNKHEDVGVVNPNNVNIPGASVWGYYRYIGSLTTPPCTEGIIWTVNRMIMTVSRQQVGALTKPLDDGAKKNARPLQPLNKHKIYFYCPRFCCPINQRYGPLMLGSSLATNDDVSSNQDVSSF